MCVSTAPLEQGVPGFPGFRHDFTATVAAAPDSTAIVDGRSGRSFSYRELLRLVQDAAATLKPLADGGPILAALPNSIDTLVVFLGALWAGIDYAPLSSHATAIEAKRLANIVKPRLAVTAHDTDPALAAALTELAPRLLSITADGYLGWLNHGATTVTEPAQPALLFMSTSGSTGAPKAMVIDSDRLWASGRAFIGQFDFADSASRFYNCLPMHYMAGLYNLGLIPLSLGATTIIAEPFSPRSLLTFWRAIEQHHINVLWLVPSIVRGLLQLAGRNPPGARPWARVEASFLGTAPIDLETKRQFESEFGIPLLENYALSETLFLTSEFPDEDDLRSQSSVGRPLPFTAFRLEAGETEGAPHRILVQTPFLMLGYRDADGNLELPLENGWFPTGDLGHLTENGTLVLKGRTRDIIKKGGVMVALREIECIAEEHPAIREAVAVGIPSAAYGEDYLLLLDSDLTIDEAARWLAERVNPQRRPGQIALRSDFPRTPSGKVRKHLIAQEWQHGSEGGPR